MKAKPVICGDGTIADCEPRLATHVKIHIPSPVGQHFIPVIIKGTREGTGKWTWNGDTEKPTLRPSVLVTSGHFVQSFKPEDQCWCKYYAAHQEETPVFHCYRCHTWINDGMAIFLPDCTHENVNKTLPLLDVT